MTKAASLRVVVCTWEPQHTLVRVDAQRRAVQDGTVARLVKKHGKTPALRAAMIEAKLVSTSKSHGEVYCAECGALTEEVLASPGIVDRYEAVRDVVEDFSAAIDRTRAAR